MQSSIVAKLLSVLTVISETTKPLTFSELVMKSGLNKSTIHRLLAIGVEEELVQFDKQRKVYLLGPKVFNLVRNAYSGYDIQAVALDEMIRLHALVNCNVTIGVPSGMEVVYLRILEAQSSQGSFQRPGMREPVHCSASGKALMAFLPDKIIRARLDGYDYAGFTERTLTSQDAFLAALEDVRGVGYGTNDREEYDHFAGISAPIFNYTSEPIAVLNIWAAQTQFTLHDLKGFSAELMASADRITSLIGGKKPEIAALRAG